MLIEIKDADAFGWSKSGNSRAERTAPSEASSRSDKMGEVKAARLPQLDTAAAAPMPNSFVVTARNAPDAQPKDTCTCKERESSINQASRTGNAADPSSLVNRTVRSKPRASASLSCFPALFRSRTTNLFGDGDKFLHVWPSTSLEAFVMEDTKITKLPFGRKRLEYGLSRVLDSGRATPWSLYADATPD